MQKHTLVSSIRRNLPRQDPAPSPAAASGGTAFEAAVVVLAALGEPCRLEDGLAKARVEKKVLIPVLQGRTNVFSSFHVQRSAKRRSCLLCYRQAEPGREFKQPSPRLLAKPCILSTLWWPIWAICHWTPGGQFLYLFEQLVCGMPLLVDIGCLAICQLGMGARPGWEFMVVVDFTNFILRHVQTSKTC